MKLYFAKGACSLAPHIVAREAGLALELTGVDLASKTTSDGADFRAIAPKAQVPLLVRDDGAQLTEGPIISQYLADLAGAHALMPAAGTAQRYRVMEWQNFLTSDLHKSYTVLFSSVDSGAKAHFGDLLHKKYALIEAALHPGPYLTGEAFTAADAYLFVVTRWADMVGLDLTGYHQLQAFMRTVAARPAVQEALRAENQA
ncbi:MAG: glutathione transferase GstA [Gammaproteobacteria bacterium]